jgi:hypothetical protein
MRWWEHPQSGGRSACFGVFSSADLSEFQAGSFYYVSAFGVVFGNVKVFIMAWLVSFSSFEKHASSWGRRLATG